MPELEASSLRRLAAPQSEAAPHASVAAPSPPGSSSSSPSLRPRGICARREATPSTSIPLRLLQPFTDTKTQTDGFSGEGGEGGTRDRAASWEEERTDSEEGAAGEGSKRQGCLMGEEERTERGAGAEGEGSKGRRLPPGGGGIDREEGAGSKGEGCPVREEERTERGAGAEGEGSKGDGCLMGEEK